MLRTSLNMDYYHDLYDIATNFGVEVEAHRMSFSPSFSSHLLLLKESLILSASLLSLALSYSLLSPLARSRSRSALIIDTETGPGVFETALAYTDSGRMADNAILFKFVAKSVGMKYGITPTFMAKPYSDVRLFLSLSLSPFFFLLFFFL